ncbi:unnamed protein product [Allacma fusca]|uniref:Uncharacterized protein n=1 Tax=Allacma fusca TaxID=39272 RepID=A0A8J2KBR6_9HEXA|nr:unnamed protein product [Allacma fusca]
MKLSWKKKIGSEFAWKWRNHIISVIVPYITWTGGGDEGCETASDSPKNNNISTTVNCIHTYTRGSPHTAVTTYFNLSQVLVIKVNIMHW